MRPLAAAVAAEGYTVEVPLLPGHGTSVADMKTTTWADWSSAALAAYDELAARVERVAVVGLSMGGMLTALLGEQRTPDALTFINPLIQHPGQEMADGLVALIDAGMDELESIGSDIKKDPKDERGYDATPLACVVSLFSALPDITANLGRITAPALLLSSREDHVVTSDNGDTLVAHTGGAIRRVWLEDSYHVATLDNDQALVHAETIAFLAEVAR
jgi:carboxylesterase